MATAPEHVELAEFTAVLSLAADMAAGLSLEHGLRSCLLATRLAARAGLPPGELRNVYYVALLRMITKRSRRNSPRPPLRRAAG